jgi:hypothetical protein
MKTGVMRTRLIWFLLGTTASALAVIISLLFVDRPVAKSATIMITEPANDYRVISLGNFLRNCGVREFSVSGVIPEAPQIVSFPVTEVNSSSLDCASKAIRENGWEWTLVHEGPQKAEMKASGFSSNR